MKKYKKQIFVGIAVLAVLVFAFWYGGNSPSLHGWDVTDSKNAVSSQTAVNEKTETAGSDINDKIKPDGEPKAEQNKPAGKNNASMATDEKIEMAARMAEGTENAAESGDENYSESQGMKFNANTGKDPYQTSPVPEGRPVPIEPQNVEISDKELTCTMSIRCDTVIDNIAWLDPEKVELVPKNGVIFPEQTVTFYEGESVFNLLLRETKKNKIHFEFEKTPVYNSAYIEGIGNLYEFDCGELSGWMYKVNGWFPNYGCSRYQLKAGDKVEFVYTCDLGIDVGGFSSALKE